MVLTDIKTVRELMNKHGVSFQKKYGQNFLINAALPQRIAEECGATENDCILEIGPGIGTLTRCLGNAAKKVVAVEIDRELMPVLGETLAEYNNIKVINADIMKTDIVKLCNDEFCGSDIYVCANLPYYITTPILMALLESGLHFKKMTFMVQKEVADRLCASAGDSEYGAVTASVNYYGAVKRLFNVSAGSFMPAPKVDSAVIQIDMYDKPPFEVKDAKLMFKVIKAAFEMRRKTLVNALNGKFKPTKEELIKIITESGFDANIRGERLSVSDFAKISDRISNY